MKISKLLVAVLVITFVTSCDKDFEEINQNPNSPTEVPASLLLPTVIRGAVYEMGGLAWNYGNVVMQHTAKIQFTNEDRYNWGPQSDPYQEFFKLLRDVNNIYLLSEEQEEKNYMAIALILKSWMFHVMTDTYGDLPYSEALKAKESVNFPKFDSQEAIYAGIISDLRDANALLGSSSESVSGDILYGGEITNWKKFANSLLLRIHMRLSDRNDPSAAMQAILNDPAQFPIFTGNDEHAAIEFLPDAPNQQPLYTTRSGSFDEFRLSEKMEGELKAIDDPRLFVYAQPTTDSGAGLIGAVDDYQGVPNGLADEEALQYAPSGDPTKGGSNFISRVGIMFACRACDVDLASPIAAQVVLMSYSELQFILAEARERGFITSGDAATYYNNGIQASFDYYQSRLEIAAKGNNAYNDLVNIIQPAATYFSQAEVDYTGTQAEKLEKIGTQKWIALFFNGLEAWADWRRTGYPDITPGSAAVISNVPTRFQYPTGVQALNLEAYQAAIARQGSDDLATRVWWDVNPN